MQRAVFFFVLLTLFVSATAAVLASTSPTPSSAPASASPATAPNATLPAPYNLRRTTNRNDCLSHGGGSYCQNPSHFNAPVLIWAWKGNFSAIDGFRVYKVTGGRTLAKQVLAFLNQRVAWGISDVHAGFCFVVTAYKGTQESADSNTWCAPYTVVP